MCKRTFALSILIAMFSAGAVEQPRHLTDAQLLVANISPDHNAYEHKGYFIKWKGEDGATEYENRSDCSDFLTLLLEHSYGVKHNQLKDWTGRIRPYAEHWHDAITAGHGFKRIENLTDARAGDVIAIKFPPGLVDSGHVMLICSPAIRIESKTPVVPGTKQWNLTIIDSSKSPHGSGDTRLQSDGTPGQGVGRGVVRIYTDNAGAVAGYTWSDGAKSRFESQTDRNLVIGRLEIAE